MEELVEKQFLQIRYIYWLLFWLLLFWDGDDGRLWDDGWWWWELINWWNFDWSNCFVISWHDKSEPQFEQTNPINTQKFIKWEIMINEVDGWEREVRERDKNLIISFLTISFLPSHLQNPNVSQSTISSIYLIKHHLSHF